MSRYSTPNNSRPDVLTPQQANFAADPPDSLDVHRYVYDFNTMYERAMILSSTNPGGMAIRSTNTHHRRFHCSKKDFKFQDRVRRLRLYGEQHGHIGVSKADDPTLYNWIRHLRNQANEFIELRRDSFPLDTVEKEMLDEMGFDWTPNQHSTAQHFRFILFHIEEFREGNGHVDDPRVETLYQEALTFLISKKSSLSKGRKAQLESFGIVLETHPPNESLSDTGCTQSSLEQIGFAAEASNNSTNNLVRRAIQSGGANQPARIDTGIEDTNASASNGESSHGSEGLHSEQQKMPRRSSRLRKK